MCIRTADGGVSDAVHTERVVGGARRLPVHGGHQPLHF